MNTNELSRYQEAATLHAQIMASGNQAAQALVEFARLLKRMRDERLYEEFDVDFDTYVEERVGIRKRQAYTYIRAYEELGPRMMGEQAHLGITKLELLAQVYPIEREAFLEENNLADMTVAEIKRLTDELHEKGEQLTFAQEENEQLRGELEKAKEPDAEQAEMLDRMKGRLAMAEKAKEDAEKAKTAAEKKAEQLRQDNEKIKSSHQRKLAEALAEEKKKTDEAMEKARQEAEERATENVKKQIAEADEERAAAIERAERLAKELKTKEDTDTAACALYIDEVKGLLNKLAERVASAKEKEPEQGKKLAGAVIRVLDAMKAPFEEIAGVKAECEQE